MAQVATGGFLGLLKLLTGLLLLGFTLPGLAHKPSDSYLHLAVQPAASGASSASLDGQWDIALRDLDFAIGLDADGNGEITWGELRARHAEIAAYALARLSVQADDTPCTLLPGSQLVDQHSDGAYSVLPFRLDCPQLAGRQPESLALTYRLFADLDPQHRGLLRLETGASTRTAIFSPEAASQRFTLGDTSRWGQFTAYVRDGIWHIWVGFDHVLFLLALLLPAALMRVPAGAGQRAGIDGLRWQAGSSGRQAVREVVAVVTAFTLAHSITLSLATLQVIALPSRWVEATIAASVVLAALNNVFGLVAEKRWAVAFGFGLIHGFGFASVLADLGLAQGSLALALVGFNVGVELGQLVIVLLFMPLAWTLRHSRFYRWGIFIGGSLLIAALAGLWFAERAFLMVLLPR
ncbi:MAG: hypothetical protein RL722_2585 [Pseudomonadota bacterium]|jgi:hypothetical protein